MIALATSELLVILQGYLAPTDAWLLGEAEWVSAGFFEGDPTPYWERAHSSYTGFRMVYFRIHLDNWDLSVLRFRGRQDVHPHRHLIA